MVEKQELHCHKCRQYVQLDLDMELNGNHVLDCPNCGHEHCRVIENGKITADRWDQRNGIQSYTISTSTVSFTAVSTFDTYSGTDSGPGNMFLYGSWMNTTSTGLITRTGT